jgi:2-polyprenyl-3-methyl-5-hydroxy-6-metoxy-1,4-benzoquinol methylase
MHDASAREMASQLARPSGEGGLKMVIAMNTTNAFITARALEVLDAAPGERLLEVGPGNGGLSAATVASLGETGGYLGFEYNEDIAAVARESLAGCDVAVEVRSGDFMRHDPKQEFDALLAVNVVYFFDDLDAFARRCHEWLRRDGRAVIGLRSMPAMAGLPFVGHGFNIRPLDELLRALHAAKFGSVQARFFDEGTTSLGDLTIAVDSIIVSATRI